MPRHRQIEHARERTRRALSALQHHPRRQTRSGHEAVEYLMPVPTGVHFRTRQRGERFSGRMDDIKHLVVATINSPSNHPPILHGSHQRAQHRSPNRLRRPVCWQERPERQEGCRWAWSLGRSVTRSPTCFTNHHSGRVAGVRPMTCPAGPRVTGIGIAEGRPRCHITVGGLATFESLERGRRRRGPGSVVRHGRGPPGEQ